MPTAYIGIGSNLGSREKNCKDAISLLTKDGIAIIKLSSMIETEPWGITDQPKFINMAIETKTGLGPEELLKVLKKTEIAMGRTPGTRWGPRVIDLDILFYDDLVIRTAELEVPHPGIKDREFVIRPLTEIAPDKIHPVFQKSVKMLFEELSG